MTRLTTDQKRAVGHLSGDLVIRAGAGSGKTTVLATRFAHAVASGAVKASDRLLTITFTTKAAAELAERVRAVLVRQGQVESARRIDSAWISTIHAFCGRLLRRHVLESGVQPFFTQLDDVEANALAVLAFEEALSSRLGQDDALRRVAQTLPYAEIRGRVISAHDNARSLGLNPEDAVVSVDADILDSLTGEVLDRVRALQWAVRSLKETESMVRAVECLTEWEQALLSCGVEESDRGGAVLDVTCTYSLRAPAGCGDLNKEVKNAIARLESAANGIVRASELGALGSLIREYASAYRRMKQARGAMDFDDLQEVAMALLAEPRIARTYRDHFDLLMVDEFQDTNGLQMSVLEPLRDDNLCVVGDERQSIYGFRYADVGIFQDVLAEKHASSVELRHNFRSHPALLRFVNALFKQPHLFGPGFMQLEPGRTDEGEPGLSDLARVECVFVDTSTRKRDGRLKEAAFIASRAAELIADGVEPGDIAVLLRGSANAGIYADAMERMAVPVLVNAGVALLDTVEAREVASLLRAVAVPADDVALHAVLAGRMVGASDDALMAVRRAAGRGSLWDGLDRAVNDTEQQELLSETDQETLRFSLAALNELHVMQGRRGLGELVEAACERFDYDLTLHSLGHEGVRAWENVLKIARLAESFEVSRTSDVAQFVDYLRERGEAGVDKPAPGDIGQGAVRIMTVHASKGLEFPVVFVADLAAPKEHAAPDIIVVPETVGEQRVPSVGFRLPDGPLGRAANATYLRNERQRVSADVEEEKRCLYVACTRARELLVVSGCCSLGKPAAEGAGLIDWVREGLPPALDGVACLGGVEVRVEELYASDSEQASDSRIAREPGSRVTYEDSGRVVPVGERELLPPTVSFSALDLHRRCPLAFHAVYRLRLGSPAQSNDPALEFGSAVHAALQAAANGSWNDSRATAIIRRHRLDEAAEKRLLGAVDTFISSPLFARVSTCDRHAAEQPLSVALGGTHLIGSIDLIAWDAGTALIVDYKTGKAPDGSGNREEAYRLQADCYALAAFESGATAVEVVFSFVEHEGALKRFSYMQTDQAELRCELERRIEEIALDREPARLAAYSADDCGSCPARGGVCRQ